MHTRERARMLLILVLMGWEIGFQDFWYLYKSWRRNWNVEIRVKEFYYIDSSGPCPTNLLLLRLKK